MSFSKEVLKIDANTVIANITSVIKNQGGGSGLLRKNLSNNEEEEGEGRRCQKIKEIWIKLC